MDSEPLPPMWPRLSPVTPDQPFIPGFSVHPHDFALIAEAAALHRVSLQDFVQLAAYSYARDWLSAYASSLDDNGFSAHRPPPDA